MSLKTVTAEIHEWLSSCGLADAEATVTITFSKPKDADRIAFNMRREIEAMTLRASPLGQVRNIKMNGLCVRIGAEVHPDEVSAIIFRDVS